MRISNLSLVLSLLFFGGYVASDPFDPCEQPSSLVESLRTFLDGDIEWMLTRFPEPPAMLHDHDQPSEELRLSLFQFGRLLSALQLESDLQLELWHSLRRWSALDREIAALHIDWNDAKVALSADLTVDQTLNLSVERAERKKAVTESSAPTAWFRWFAHTLSGMTRMVNVLYLLGFSITLSACIILFRVAKHKSAALGTLVLSVYSLCTFAFGLDRTLVAESTTAGAGLIALSLMMLFVCVVMALSESVNTPYAQLRVALLSSSSVVLGSGLALWLLVKHWLISVPLYAGLLLFNVCLLRFLLHTHHRRGWLCGVLSTQPLCALVVAMANDSLDALLGEAKFGVLTLGVFAQLYVLFTLDRFLRSAFAGRQQPQHESDRAAYQPFELLSMLLYFVCSPLERVPFALLPYQPAYRVGDPLAASLRDGVFTAVRALSLGWILITVSYLVPLTYATILFVLGLMSTIASLVSLADLAYTLRCTASPSLSSLTQAQDPSLGVVLASRPSTRRAFMLSVGALLLASAHGFAMLEWRLASVASFVYLLVCHLTTEQLRIYMRPEIPSPHLLLQLTNVFMILCVLGDFLFTIFSAPVSVWILVVGISQLLMTLFFDLVLYGRPVQRLFSMERRLWLRLQQTFFFSIPSVLLALGTYALCFHWQLHGHVEDVWWQTSFQQGNLFLLSCALVSLFMFGCQRPDSDTQTAQQRTLAVSGALLCLLFFPDQMAVYECSVLFCASLFPLLHTSLTHWFGGRLRAADHLSHFLPCSLSLYGGGMLFFFYLMRTTAFSPHCTESLLERDLVNSPSGIVFTLGSVALALGYWLHLSAALRIRIGDDIPLLSAMSDPPTSVCSLTPTFLPASQPPSPVRFRALSLLCLVAFLWLHTLLLIVSASALSYTWICLCALMIVLSGSAMVELCATEPPLPRPLTYATVLVLSLAAITVLYLAAWYTGTPLLATLLFVVAFGLWAIQYVAFALIMQGRVQLGWRLGYSLLHAGLFAAALFGTAWSRATVELLLPLGVSALGSLHIHSERTWALVVPRVLLGTVLLVSLNTPAFVQFMDIPQSRSLWWWWLLRITILTLMSPTARWAVPDFEDEDDEDEGANALDDESSSRSLTQPDAESQHLRPLAVQEHMNSTALLLSVSVATLLAWLPSSLRPLLPVHLILPALGYLLVSLMERSKQRHHANAQANTTTNAHDQYHLLLALVCTCTLCLALSYLPVAAFRHPAGALFPLLSDRTLLRSAGSLTVCWLLSLVVRAPWLASGGDWLAVALIGLHAVGVFMAALTSQPLLLVAFLASWNSLLQRVRLVGQWARQLSLLLSVLALLAPQLLPTGGLLWTAALPLPAALWCARLAVAGFQTVRGRHDDGSVTAAQLLLEEFLPLLAMISLSALWSRGNPPLESLCMRLLPQLREWAPTRLLLGILPAGGSPALLCLYMSSVRFSEHQRLCSLQPSSAVRRGVHFASSVLQLLLAFWIGPPSLYLLCFAQLLYLQVGLARSQPPAGKSLRRLLLEVMPSALSIVLAWLIESQLLLVCSVLLLLRVIIGSGDRLLSMLKVLWPLLLTVAGLAFILAAIHLDSTAEGSNLSDLLPEGLFFSAPQQVDYGALWMRQLLGWTLQFSNHAGS